jgi:hypothetical protein
VIVVEAEKVGPASLFSVDAVPLVHAATVRAKATKTRPIFIR